MTRLPIVLASILTLCGVCASASASSVKPMPMQELDRGRAITLSIERAAAADVILLAGKGHEPYQEIAGVRHPFSDLDCAKSALAIRQERGDRELQHD